MRQGLFQAVLHFERGLNFVYLQHLGFYPLAFQQTSLPPDETGEKLLVGRDAELTQLVSRLQDSTKIPIVEGLNGIGKTSLVNVAAHRLYQTHLAGRGALFIPCFS